MSANSSGRKVEGSLLPAAIAVLLFILERAMEAAWGGSTPVRVIAIGACGLFGLVVLAVLAILVLSYVDERRTVSFDGAVITLGGLGSRKARVALADITDVVARGHGALEIRAREAKVRLTRHELLRSGVLRALRALPSFRRDAMAHDGQSIVVAPNVSLWTKPALAGAVYRKR